MAEGSTGPRYALVSLAIAILGVAIAFAAWQWPKAPIGTGALPSTTSAPSSPAPTSTKGRLLSDGPVKVSWTGDGETLEVRWEAMSYPRLDHYSVDVYGKYPADTWVNDGYRRGEELDTFRVIHPVADTKYYYETVNKDIPAGLGSGETWQICVTGQESAPADDPGRVVPIKESRRCSDTFTVPA